MFECFATLFLSAMGPPESEMVLLCQPPREVEKTWTMPQLTCGVDYG